MGFKYFCTDVPQNSVRDARIPGVFKLKKANLSDNACQHFDLPTVAEQNSHQAAITRKEQGKKMCELVWTEVVKDEDWICKQESACELTDVILLLLLLLLCKSHRFSRFSKTTGH